MEGSSVHKILVVDDDQDILNFIKHDFSKYSVEVITCTNVERAIVYLGNEVFTLGIIDIVMGEGISSERLIKLIREDVAGENKNLPIAIMSAHMNVDYAKKLRLKGSNVYATIKKPLKINDFSQEILGLNHKTVLIIDDDLDIISLMKSELEHGDYQVFSSPRNQLGIKIVDLIDIDIIIIDNKLGVDVDSSLIIEFLKREHPEIPCILTGKEIRSDLLWNENLNIIGTISKPLERGALLDTMNEYFSEKEDLSDHVIGSGAREAQDEKTLVKGDNFELKDDHFKVKGAILEDEQDSVIVGGEDYSEPEEAIIVAGESEGDIGEKNTMVKGHGAQNSISNQEVLTFKGLYNDEETRDDLDGFQVNQRNKKGQTPVMIYCYLGDIESVKKLIDEGADIRLKARSGKTCLHYAAYSGNTSLVDYLVQYQGLKINERDEYNYTPLYDAIKTGNIKMVRACIELGARLTFFIEGKSYLTFAVLFGHCEIAQYLFNLGIDAHKKDYKGMSPMDYAIKKRRKDLVDALKKSDTSSIS